MAQVKAADFGMAPPIAVVATCSLNQWVLDFEGNKRRILESVRVAKEKGCKYRLGPELEITGYNCEDHFYELDTIKFAWKVLGELMSDPITKDILCDFSMPVLHNGVRYNCRMFCLNKKLLLIRPKMWMADDGNYREERWFTPWSKDKISVLEDYVLSDEMFAITGQRTAKFGVGIVEAVDASIASEVCEELFTPESPNIMWGLEGVDIISNGSASHWQMGKRAYRHSLIGGATSRNGGAYMYSNMLGCDGNRLVFDGNSMIYKNGKLLATGEHLSFQEVEVVTASINLDDVRAHRSAIVSRGIQADRRNIKAPRVMVEDYVPGFRLTCCSSKSYDETTAMAIPVIGEEEEMGLGLSRYLWDYLVRSTAGGFFLPLSGGVDSGSTSLVVYYMCNKIMEIVNAPLRAGDVDYDDKLRLWTFVNTSLNNVILGKFNQRGGYAKYTIKAPYNGANNAVKLTTKGLMNILLHTCNMPTNNNTPEIRKQASDLAAALGCYHLTTPINDAFVAAKNMVKDVHFGVTVDQRAVNGEKAAMREETPHKMMEIPRYKSSDGDWQENLAIQNIQARLRMVTAYYMAQILPLHRWNQDYGGASGGVEGWQKFYEAKMAALAEAKKAEPGVSEDKLSYKKYLKGLEAELQEKIIKTRGSAPFLLVLASSNSDEALRGFFTKYDAGSADINPIGSFSKTELRKFMKWIMLTKFHGHLDEVSAADVAAAEADVLAGLPAGVNRNSAEIKMKIKEEAKLQAIIAKSDFEPVNRILNVTASPELTPTAPGGAVQDDEVEIELTYKDLYDLGLLRKRDNLGPYSMFLRLCKDRMGKPMEFVNLKDPRNKFKETVLATPTLLSVVVERFFNWYNKNRSKMTILTPGIHATNYSPDDNRYDQRPYLYPFFPDSYQMKLIKKVAAEMEEKIKADSKGGNASPKAAAAANALVGAKGGRKTRHNRKGLRNTLRNRKALRR